MTNGYQAYAQLVGNPDLLVTTCSEETWILVQSSPLINWIILGRPAISLKLGILICKVKGLNSTISKVPSGILKIIIH